MKILYIAGPFSAPPFEPDPLHAVNINIEQASRAALAAWQLGWCVICPHKNTQGFQHVNIPPEVWYQGDAEILTRCDAILLLHGWESSRGAVFEAALAKMLEIPVFYMKDGIPRPEAVG